MKVYRQESHRYVIERTKGNAAILGRELVEALQVMPNGWGVTSIENRPDGTTIVHMQDLSRKPVNMPRP